MNINPVEIIGYIGSILVAVSLTMRSLLRLRLINLFGAFFFMIYGIMLGAYPIAILNGLIVCIDVYYLFRMWQQKDYFTFLEVTPKSDYMRIFLGYYKDDITRIIPNFSHDPQESLICFFILRNMMPAGLFIAKIEGGDANIKLDYVIPNYRDFKVARFIFEENAGVFTQRGIRRFVSEGGSSLHRRYLERMGFHKSGGMFVHEVGSQILRNGGF